MAKQPIPVREVVRLSGKTRQAIYKAITAGRLTEADLYGVQAVADDKKLAEFLSNGNGNKKGKR
jgi:hypothetical protein